MKSNRAQLRSLLQQKQILLAPGAYDGLGAKLIERAGFPLVYASGGAIARSIGLPDLGLVSFSEVIQRVREISRATLLPVIADADTGYGNALNVMRTVSEFEEAGVAALHIEDQIFPKRCGHYEGQSLIPAEEMAGKIEATVRARQDPATLIIARTDARSAVGLDEALARARVFLEAGADAIFVEALASLEEIKTISREIKAPLIFNMTEGGKSPLVPISRLQDLGFKIVLFPSDLQRALIGTGKRILQERLEGKSGLLDGMCSFKERDEIVDLDLYLNLEKRYVR